MGAGLRQARAHRRRRCRSCSRARSAPPRSTTNSAGPNIYGYFRTFEQRVETPGRSPLRGYHKPIMIAGGLGNIRRAHVEKAPVVAGREDRRARRPGDADRTRRWRGVVDGRRRQLGGPRFRIGAARQSRNAASRAGSHRRLLGDGRREPDPAHPRRRCRRSLERDSRIGALRHDAAAASTCARSRATSPACRRSKSGATNRRSATCW